MKIADVAQASGLSAKTIRYYEDIGLVRPARGTNGYRAFVETDVHKLRFPRPRPLPRVLDRGVPHAAFALRGPRARASADVKALAEAHLRRIDHKIVELEGLRGTLATLVARCHGDERPDCPILDDLAGPSAGDAQ